MSIKPPRRVDDIAAQAQLSPRALRRFFETQMGLSARHYLSLLRFERLLRNVHPDPWMERAHHGPDYADQAHACREFKRFSGMTQSQYRALKRMAGDKLVHTLVATTSGN
ncbi:MAG: helix-turn-helix domain-containing protein [Hyphomonadaceae bacterium]|nr:helix-turn-helix domain-containing protein [Hyphomonadaceae bacterium]